MLDYLIMFEEAANKFPGFDSEIQGVYRETTPDGGIKFYTYVVQEESMLPIIRRNAMNDTWRLFRSWGFARGIGAIGPILA